MNMKTALPFFIVCSCFITPLAFAQDNAQSTAGFEAQPSGETTELAPPPPAQAAPASAPAAVPAQKNNQTLQPAGQVVWVNGTVQAAYPEQTPRILARGSMIYEKDKITTDASGSGQLSFTDNSMVTLNPSSVFIIEQYYFNQEKPQQGGQSVMNLVKGGLRTVTGFVAKAAPANYQVKTPVATIGVRGTDYQASCPKAAGICAFALIHGQGITLSNAAGMAEVTPELPYASVASYTAKAVLSKVAPGDLGPAPTIAPANAPPPGGKSGGGNCGILIN